jgi:Uma2 family endonuclease
VSKKRLSIIEKQRVNGAPDLIVEVLSPKTEDRDRGFKFRRYAQEGVQEYWLADPDKRVVEVYTLTLKGFELFGTFTGDEEVCSKILEGLRFPVSDVWR